MKTFLRLFILSFISFFSLCQLLYCQGISNIFMYGYMDAGRGFIKFDSGFPITFYDTLRTINMNVTHANIADKNGNLLFYTNGVTICDVMNNVMPNGNTLNPSIYTNNWTYFGLRLPQADIILPFPNDSNLFYLIHLTVNDNSNFLTNEIYYSVINKTLHGGLGDVSLKGINFLQDTIVQGQLTACKHANGRDWWLIIPEYAHPSYYVYLISPIGIQLQSKQTIGQRYYGSAAAFSKDGTHYGMYDMDTDIEIFDFDRCNGTFSNCRNAAINDSMFGIGFSFSPNSKIAYASSAHFLYQVNLDSIDISSSLTIVASWDSTYNPFPPIETGFEEQKLASDGKTYIATTGTTQYMHIINYPDSAGIACNVMQHALYLGDSVYNWNTVPNHPNYFLGPVVGSICDSLSLGVPENAPFNFNISVYPNPTESNFTVNYRLPQNKKGVLEIINVLGERVYSLNLPQWSTMQKIQLTELARGVYGMRIRSGVHSVVRKIVIQ